MRIHSDSLTRQDFQVASTTAGVRLVTCDSVRSRSHIRAFSFTLERPTWDEWGMFLNRLYRVDPVFHCGARPYRNAGHFHWMTGDRFRTLTPELQHKAHKWIPLGQSATGPYGTSRCQCGAIQRWELDPGWFEAQHN